MKIKDYAIVILIIIGLILYFQWRIGKLQSTIDARNTEFNNSFKQLSDGMAAKAATKVVLPPNEWQKLFNTSANKEFKKFIEQQIPLVIRQEVEKIKIQPGGTTVINKSSILIQGDSAYFRNSEGLVTKTAKVIPVNADSSLFILVPQEIEITGVEVKPDPKRTDSLLFFMSAINKITGDTLKVNQSISYVIPRDYKKFKFDFFPYIGSSYNPFEKDFVFKAGVTPILFRGKTVDAEFLGVEVSYGIKSKEAIEISLINLQLKKKRY